MGFFFADTLRLPRGDLVGLANWASAWGDCSDGADFAIVAAFFAVWCQNSLIAVDPKVLPLRPIRV